jgi:hypothetical protein
VVGWWRVTSQRICLAALLLTLSACPQDNAYNPCLPCTGDRVRVDAALHDAGTSDSDARDADIGDAGLVDADSDEAAVCYVACDPDEDPFSCEEEPQGCVQVCDAEHPCTDEGHPCVPYRDRNVCSFECVSSACNARRECRVGECRDVECGAIVPCANSADICDVKAFRCYPFDGRCSSVDDCPIYDGYWTANANVSCAGGYCSVGLRPPTPPPDLGPVPPVGIISPAPGTKYLDENGVIIQWASDFAGAGASTIILIVDGYPQSKNDLDNHAVWGAALRPGEAGPIMLSAGQLVSQGMWTGQPGPLPQNRLLTVVIEIVREGQLLAVSDVIPFSIGQAWPARGDSCDPADGPQGCASPTEVMSCHPLTFSCERVCASYRDCLGISPARDCAAPRGLSRFCE